MEFLKDILFPKFCFGCNGIGSYICLGCQDKMSPINYDSCFYCSKKSYLGLTHAICKRQNGVDGMLCAFRYNPVLKKVIKNIKYRLVREAMNELLSTVPISFFEKIGIYKSFNKEVELQPVPLHPNRLKFRGFNQSILLGQYISQVVSISLTDIIKRTKDTRSQAMLVAKKSRHSNLRGAFSLINKDDIVNTQNIILIDDVLTTGATCREAARVLKSSGASNVYVVALAKG